MGLNDVKFWWNIKVYSSNQCAKPELRFVSKRKRKKSSENGHSNTQPRIFRGLWSVYFVQILRDYISVKNFENRYN